MMCFEYDSDDFEIMCVVDEYDIYEDNIDDWWIIIYDLYM